KHEATPDNEKGNLGYLIELCVNQMICEMLNTRLSELRQLPRPLLLV
ncbi:hypothetical protein EZS27_041087, partial [termite gut metagenome]